MKTFLLPDLGEGLQEAEIVSWHVGIGDHVVADQPLVSVETAKAVVELPSPWSGRVAALHGAPGDVLAINAPLAEIETEEDGANTGTGVGTREAAPAAAPTPPPAAPPRMPSADLRASPAVRKLARDLGVDLGGLSGSGPQGAITREDVQAAAGSATADEGYERLRGVRRAMAETITRAGAEVVPATVTDEALIEAWPADADPTVRLIRAIVAGCAAAPALNAWYDGRRAARRLHDRVDLGIAMETDDGLFVPVLRDAGARKAADLRAGLEAMKRDVSARSVPVSELRGQTITLSNFGMFGGLHAALSVVPPQVAILGAGRVHRAARVVDRVVVPVTVLPLSLTFDHRAVTGAEATRFLAAVITSLDS